MNCTIEELLPSHKLSISSAEICSVTEALERCQSLGFDKRGPGSESDLKADQACGVLNDVDATCKPTSISLRVTGVLQRQFTATASSSSARLALAFKDDVTQDNTNDFQVAPATAIFMELSDPLYRPKMKTANNTNTNVSGESLGRVGKTPSQLGTGSSTGPKKSLGGTGSAVSGDRRRVMVKTSQAGHGVSSLKRKRAIIGTSTLHSSRRSVKDVGPTLTVDVTYAVRGKDVKTGYDEPCKEGDLIMVMGEVEHAAHGNEANQPQRPIMEEAPQTQTNSGHSIPDAASSVFILRARIVREVNGTDMQLQKKTVELRRKFLQQRFGVGTFNSAHGK
jgi:hypothetical protein